MKLEEMTDKAIDYIVNHTDTSLLDDWERDFFAKVSGDWALRRALSDKQKMKLGEIWDQQP